MSRQPSVTGDVWVFFDAGSYGQVTIYGRVRGATVGQVAVLYAQQFPFTRPPGEVASQGLTASGFYSFAASPTLATRYSVLVLARRMAGQQLAASATKTVYVVPNQFGPVNTSCNSPGNRPVCRQRWRIYIVVPASAYREESAKHWYVYFGLALARLREPALPKWLYVDHHAKVSQVRRISSTEFERVISLSFRLGDDAWHFGWNYCAKDTEAVDGVGLPGHHDCGQVRVSSKQRYLG